jgi:hypothetical protein
MRGWRTWAGSGSGAEPPHARPHPASPRICRPSPCKLWRARAGREGAWRSPVNARAPPLTCSAVRPCARSKPRPPHWTPLTASARAAGPGRRAAHAHGAVPGGLCRAGAARARDAQRRAAPRGPPRAPPARRGPRPPARRQLPRAAAGAPLPARGLPGARGCAAGARPARRTRGMGAGISASQSSAEPVVRVCPAGAWLRDVLQSCVL